MIIAATEVKSDATLIKNAILQIMLLKNRTFTPTDNTARTSAAIDVGMPTTSMPRAEMAILMVITPITPHARQSAATIIEIMGIILFIGTIVT